MADSPAKASAFKVVKATPAQIQEEAKKEYLNRKLRSNVEKLMELVQSLKMKPYKLKNDSMYF